MDRSDERFFETINGDQICCSSFVSANTVEIQIDNLGYDNDRKRTIQHIVVVLICCLLLNVILHLHAIQIALNIVLFVTMVTKCYMLANLIEFGKLQILKSMKSIQIDGMYLCRII